MFGQVQLFDQVKKVINVQIYEDLILFSLNNNRGTLFRL